MINNAADRVVFWAGAGISKESGAPLSREMSNAIIKALCGNDRIMLENIYGSIPSTKAPSPNNLLKPWNILPSELKVESNSIILDKYQSVDYLRLEVVLEGLRQAFPNKVGSIIAHFNRLEPNDVHYLLAKAISFGHSVITTNWDNLIEKAAQRLNIRFCTQIWNPKNDRVEVRGQAEPTAGNLVKLHGSIEYDSGDPLTYIHQFTLGPPNSVKVLLEGMLKFKLVIFLGYSFSDHFDYQEIISTFPKKNVSAFVICHDPERIKQDSWKRLDTSDDRLAKVDGVSKSGIVANSRYYLKHLVGDNYEYPFLFKNIMPDIIRDIEKLDEGRKKGSIYWLLNNLGRPEALHVVAAAREIDHDSDWYSAINLVQAKYLGGRLIEGISIIGGILKKYELERCTENDLIHLMELLERGLEIALTNASPLRARKYYRHVLKIYEYAIANGTEENKREIEKRFNHIRNNIRAVERMVRFLNIFTRRVMDLRRQRTDGRDFFALNIAIYYKRSEAVKGKNVDGLIRCYKSYLEMCNIDGALGTLIDISLRSCKNDLDGSIRLLEKGKEIVRANTGSIYARIKLHAVLLSFLLVESVFCRQYYKRRICNWLDELREYAGSINGFDSKWASVAWLGRSIIFFFGKGLLKGIMYQLKKKKYGG
jgi:hypothetical protein